MTLKNFLAVVLTISSIYCNSQVIGSEIKDCVSGTYTYTDENGRVYKLIFDYSLKLEIESHVYTSAGTSAGEKNRYIGPVYFVGKWGSPDANTINIFYGKLDESKTDMTREKGAGYFAYQHQNAGVRAPFNEQKGEIVLRGQTYKKVGGPCKRNTDSNNENVPNTVDAAQPQVNLIYTGNETAGDIIRDDFVRTFNTPSEFNAYASGMNVKRVGEALVQNLSNNLKQIQGLVNTTDPVVLLQDFNQKISQIEQLQANFNSEFNSYSTQIGLNIGNSIGNKDYEGAVFQGLGLLNALSERNEAQKQLEEQKQALYRERRNRMSDIFDRAVEYNNSVKAIYLKKAAFTESLEDETFNLSFVTNLECHIKSMDENWSSSHTEWLENRCDFPKKQRVSSSLPKTKSNDTYYLNLAEHKNKVYELTGYIEFRHAAIHFAAEAARIRPTAKKFMTLANYYYGVSHVYELSYYLTAKSYSNKDLSSEHHARISHLTRLVEKGVKTAIYVNDVEYLTSFMNSRFDEFIQIEGMHILDFIIRLDHKDMIAPVLDVKFDRLKAKDQNLFLQRAIMLSILYDSHESFKYFVDSDISLDFKYNGMSPVELIYELQSLYCLSIYLSKTRGDNVSFFNQGFAIVTDGWRHGLINTKGEEIVKYEDGYTWLRPPSGGLIVAAKGFSMPYGAIDLEGNVKIPFIYDYLGNCYNDRILAKKDDLYGYLNSSGAVVIPFKYDFATDFNHHYAEVGNWRSPLSLSTTSMKYHLIDENGSKILHTSRKPVTFINPYLVECDGYVYSVRDLIQKKRIPIIKGNRYKYFKADFRIEGDGYCEMTNNHYFSFTDRVEANDVFTILNGKDLVYIYFKDSLLLSFRKEDGEACVQGELLRLQMTSPTGAQVYFIDRNCQKIVLPTNDSLDVKSLEYAGYGVFFYENKAGLRDYYINSDSVFLMDPIERSDYYKDDGYISVKRGTLVDRFGRKINVPFRFFEDLDSGIPDSWMIMGKYTWKIDVNGNAYIAYRKWISHVDGCKHPFEIKNRYGLIPCSKHLGYIDAMGRFVKINDVFTEYQSSIDVKHGYLVGSSSRKLARIK